MTAQIGADRLDPFDDPRPELLIDVAPVQPEPGGIWIHLEERLGFRSTQRLWISDVTGGVVVAATWPAELARQARYLYGAELGSALVAADSPAPRCRRALSWLDELVRSDER